MCDATRVSRKSKAKTAKVTCELYAFPNYVYNSRSHHYNFVF